MNTTTNTSNTPADWYGRAPDTQSSTERRTGPRSDPAVAKKQIPEADILIIGCGVAGCSTALKAAELGRSVTLLSAHQDATQCNSFWAQGGIIYKATNDHRDLLEKDIHTAGVRQNKHEAVAKLAVEGPAAVEEFLLEGSLAEVPFDRSADGSLARCFEAAHNRARIIHWRDHTGKAIMEALIKAVKANSRITLLTGCTAVDLALTQSGTCVGAHVLHEGSGEVVTVLGGSTVLATGGCGEVYQHTSNPREARGDGLAMAMRAGAEVDNMEYMQFHPTTLYIPGERRFLVTEALRGEGAVLLSATSARTRFATKYHPDGELAPRDVVARMILSEMEQTGTEFAYLDISHRDSDWLKNRFPAIYAHCLSRGIDITKEPMPVVPAAHYHCGGIRVDLNGRTTVPNLFACGEVTCTGLHGANRLASTSLLEALVWGKSVAREVNQTLGLVWSRSAEWFGPGVAREALRDITLPPGGGNEADPHELEEFRDEIKKTTWELVGIVRQPKALEEAVVKLESLRVQADELFKSSAVTSDTIGLRNIAMVAVAIATGAKGNPHSIGTHHLVPDVTNHLDPDDVEAESHWSMAQSPTAPASSPPPASSAMDSSDKPAATATSLKAALPSAGLEKAVPGAALPESSLPGVAPHDRIPPAPSTLHKSTSASTITGL